MIAILRSPDEASAKSGEGSADHIPDCASLHPGYEPGSAKLLALGATGKLRHALRAELPALLRPGDLVVANDVSATDAGFAVDDNRVILVDKGSVVEVPHAPKSVIAHRILDRVATLLPKH